MTALIESIRIRGGDVRQSDRHGLSFMELVLPLPGYSQAWIQIRRECRETPLAEEVILETLREAQVIVDTVIERMLTGEE